MGLKEDYIYWKLIEFLIVNKSYSILNLSQDQREIWLENISEKEAKVAIDFTEKFLQYIYVIPKEIEEIESQMESKSNGSPAKVS